MQFLRALCTSISLSILHLSDLRIRANIGNAQIDMGQMMLFHISIIF